MSLRNLTPEEEEKLVNKLADEIVKRGLEFPASIFLDVIGPTTDFLGHNGFSLRFSIYIHLGRSRP